MFSRAITDAVECWSCQGSFERDIGNLLPGQVFNCPKCHATIRWNRCPKCETIYESSPQDASCPGCAEGPD